VASRVSRTRERIFTVVEEDRYFYCDLAAGSMISARKDENGAGRRSTYKAGRPDPVRDELKAFVRAVRLGTDAPVSGEDGLAALIVANAIEEKIEQHLTLGASGRP
jgi:predicted dehydrogenase